MENRQIYKGVITAMITPQKNNQVDYDALGFLLDRQINADIDGVVIAGSTGEGVCLSMQEFDNIFSEACKISSGRIPIIAGIATASTAEALEKTQLVQKHGVDGLMLTVPYYTKPSQEGVLEHYKLLHDNSNLPILVYNHPGRTGSALSDNTIIELAQMDRVIALKDASSNMQRPFNLKNSAMLGDEFSFLAGNDDEILTYMASGGSGVVSVLSNVMPKTIKNLLSYVVNNELDEAQKLYKKILNISKIIFALPNPIGIKCAHKCLNHCLDDLRLPLIPASEEDSADIMSIIPLIQGLEDSQR